MVFDAASTKRNIFSRRLDRLLRSPVTAGVVVDRHRKEKSRKRQAGLDNMPELPDVEVYRRYLTATALHKRIDHVHVECPTLLSGTSPQGLGRVLKGKTFESARRHGKYLFIELNNGERWLVMHFGMTGDLKYFQHEQDQPDFTQLLIAFRDGSFLAYSAPRKLGLIALTDRPPAFAAERELGPDALSFSEKAFVKLASQRRGGVKSWLMDQHTISGLGNVYSDEILFRAGIHPRRAVSDIDEAGLKRLYRSMRDVLKTAINAQADPDRMPSSFLLPHRDKGGHCPKCHAALAEVRAAGRSAWYCPRCQKL